MSRVLDHDEVRRRLAAGESKSDLARELGVTYQAIRLVVIGYIPCDACGSLHRKAETSSGLCAACYRATLRAQPCPRGHTRFRIKPNGRRVFLDCDAERKRAQRSDPATAHAENQARMDRHRRARERSAT